MRILILILRKRVTRNKFLHCRYLLFSNSFVNEKLENVLRSKTLLVLFAQQTKLDNRTNLYLGFNQFYTTSK